MNLSGKKVLVTGADGFIGSHLTEALVRRGHDVRAFVSTTPSTHGVGSITARREVAGKFECSPATSAIRTACALR